jgi:hypothetical protein
VTKRGDVCTPFLRAIWEDFKARGGAPSTPALSKNEHGFAQYLARRDVRDIHLSWSFVPREPRFRVSVTAYSRNEEWNLAFVRRLRELAGNDPELQALGLRVEEHHRPGRQRYLSAWFGEQVEVDDLIGESEAQRARLHAWAVETMLTFERAIAPLFPSVKTRLGEP